MMATINTFLIFILIEILSKLIMLSRASCQNAVTLCSLCAL